MTTDPNLKSSWDCHYYQKSYLHLLREIVLAVGDRRERLCKDEHVPSWVLFMSIVLTTMYLGGPTMSPYNHSNWNADWPGWRCSKDVTNGHQRIKISPGILCQVKGKPEAQLSTRGRTWLPGRFHTVLTACLTDQSWDNDEAVMGGTAH